MNKHQVFVMWKSKWFKDQPDLERRYKKFPNLEAEFLASPEVAELSKMSWGTVKRAIDVDPSLKLILRAAKNPTPQPKLTASQYPKNVYISGGGDVFHRDRNCAALKEGQRKVSRRGGTPAPVNPVQFKQAKNMGKEPCQSCFPPNRKR